MAFNSSEEYLGALSRKTFLSMWSYQNPFYSKGKELCDVLVVFGNDVIVMSDKYSEFNCDAELSVSWRRWYKKAVASSVRQLRGARAQILNFPESIYCDAQASSPFPLKLPSQKDMRIHLVAVANGCESASAKYLEGAGFAIDSSCSDGESEFVVGTNYPEFVHVFSKAALDVAFECLDTVRDFIDYLSRKESFLASGERILILGEENLVAAYMLSQPGGEEFSIPTNFFLKHEDGMLLENGLWELYVEKGLRKRREGIRAPSYVVDRIIEHIAEEYQGGSLVVGQSKPLTYHERAFRLMASESRLGRQLISAPLLDVVGSDSSTFWCQVVGSKDVSGLYYLWLVYPLIPDDVTDEVLERVIARHLKDYLYVALYKFPDAQRVFGVCLPNKNSSRRSISFRVIERSVWNSELEKEAQRLEREQGILSSIETYHQSGFRV